MNSTLDIVRRLNSKRGLNLKGSDVRLLASKIGTKCLPSEVERKALSILAETNEPSEFKIETLKEALKIVRKPPPRIVGQTPILAHGYSCPRCNNGELMSVNVRTANTQLPFCAPCRIIITPEA